MQKLHTQLECGPGKGGNSGTRQEAQKWRRCIALHTRPMRAKTRVFATSALRGWWVISQTCQGGQGSEGWGDRNYVSLGPAISFIDP